MVNFDLEEPDVYRAMVEYSMGLYNLLNLLKIVKLTWHGNTIMSMTKNKPVKVEFETSK